jgi:hypothetical protein
VKYFVIKNRIKNKMFVFSFVELNEQYLNRENRESKQIKSQIQTTTTSFVSLIVYKKIN